MQTAFPTTTNPNVNLMPTNPNFLPSSLNQQTSFFTGAPQLTKLSKPSSANMTQQTNLPLQQVPSNISGPIINTTSQVKNYTNLRQVNQNQIPKGTQKNIVNNQGKIVTQATGIAHQNQQIGKPYSTTRVQYVPYDKKVVQYETRQIVSNMWVPVQRKALNYYAIQHITQYIPRQVDDVRYELVPQQKTEYRLQYVPVEKQIVHYPNQNGQINFNVNQEVQANRFNQQNIYIAQQIPPKVENHVALGQIQIGRIQNNDKNLSIPGYQKLQNRVKLPRSNFVTCDGYVPSFMLENSSLNTGLQRILSRQNMKDEKMKQPNHLVNDKSVFEGIGSNFKSQQGRVQRGQSFALSNDSKPRQTRLTEYENNGWHDRF